MTGAGIATSGSEGAGAVVAIIGAVLFFGSLIPYIGSMYFAYKVQEGLHDAGMIKSGPWQIVVAALILNPYLAGFYVPLSVSLAANRAASSRQVAA